MIDSGTQGMSLVAKKGVTNMDKFVGLAGAVGAWWSVKTGFFHMEDFIVFAAGWWVADKTWGFFKSLV